MAAPFLDSREGSLLEEGGLELVARVLGVTQEHCGVGLEEHGVVHTRVARRHGALENHNVLRVPYLILKTKRTEVNKQQKKRRSKKNKRTNKRTQY